MALLPVAAAMLALVSLIAWFAARRATGFVIVLDSARLRSGRPAGGSPAPIGQPCISRSRTSRRGAANPAFSVPSPLLASVIRHREIVPKSSIMESDARRQQIAREAKALVALTFRNGPIQEVHAGRHCPTCAGNAEYSRITDEEMKAMIKNAVDQLYALLVLKIEKPDEYERRIQFGERYTAKWTTRRHSKRVEHFAPCRQTLRSTVFVEKRAS